jgi:hypothetical protein
MKRKCRRCKTDKLIESHHIIFKSHGGTNEDKNKEDLCKACHDYEHTKFSVVEYLEYCENRLESLNVSVKKINKNNSFYKSWKKSINYYKKRVKLVKYRLEVLESLNLVENVLQYGYRSYWIDQKTHGPRRRKKK